MQNRSYQTDAIDNCIDKLSQYRKVLLQLPTGGGKTVIFTLLSQRYIQNTDKAVMIIVHREELMYQAMRTIESIMKIKPYLITSETKKFAAHRIYIGMVDSMMSRLDLFHNVGLVIIDECHVANFNKVHSIFLEELILGVSATPKSASKKDPINRYYNAIVCGPQIRELIKSGFLAQNVTRCPAEIVDATKLQIDKLKGDFNERQMSDEFRIPRHVINVVKNYHKYCIGKKTIIFNVTIDHSKDVNECFVSCGFNSRHMDATSSNRPSERPGFRNEREEILDWFKNTPDAILQNVMIATVGFDEPTIRNVILNFSTLSIVKFIQTSGRGSRFIAGEKEMFNIIDMGGNSIRFGDWNDDRDWEAIFNTPEHLSNGVAPVKTCPQCFGLVHAAVRMCPLHKENGDPCEYEFERHKTPEEEYTQELIIVTQAVNVWERNQKNKNKYEYYTFLEMAIDVVDRLFAMHEKPTKEEKEKYFKMYYQLCIDWYRVTLAYKNGNPSSIVNSEIHIKRARNNFDNLVFKKEKTLKKANLIPTKTTNLGRQLSF